MFRYQEQGAAKRIFNLGLGSLRRRETNLDNKLRFSIEKRILHAKPHVCRFFFQKGDHPAGLGTDRYLKRHSHH